MCLTWPTWKHAVDFMFAGTGQQSLVLTLTPDFRKVRHILFGSEYGAKFNIFKWIIIPNCSGKLFCKVGFFLFPSPLQNTPPHTHTNTNFQLFSLSPNPKLQNTPPKYKFPTFFPKSKSKVTEYPPPQYKFPIFFPKAKSEVTEYPPKIQISNFFS